MGQHQPGATESVDSISLTVLDAGGGSNTGTLSVRIADDTPTANADARNLSEGTAASPAADVTGNVFASGATGDVADALGADTQASPVTAVSFGGTPGTLGSALAGSYGTLTLNANGNFNFDVPPMPGVTFTAFTKDGLAVKTFTTDSDGNDIAGVRLPDLPQAQLLHADLDADFRALFMDGGQRRAVIALDHRCRRPGQALQL